MTLVIDVLICQLIGIFVSILDFFANGAVFVLCNNFYLLINVVAFVVCDKLNIISGTTASVLCNKINFFLIAVLNKNDRRSPR